MRPTDAGLSAAWFGDLLNLEDAEQFRTDETGMDEEVMAMFHLEIQESLEGLEAGVPARDAIRVRESAHSLQGMGGAVGAPELSLVGLALSDAVRATQWERAHSLTTALRGWYGEWKGGGRTSSPQTNGPELEGLILVVDDEEPNRRFLQGLLEDCGAEVMLASSGEQALELVQGRLPDVALVDVNMKGIDGYEVCRRFKEQPVLRRTSVIMVTARHRVEDIETGFELGAFDYIRKPYHSRELLARVRNALHVKRWSDDQRTWKENLSRELRMAGALQAALFNPLPVMQGHCTVRTAYSPSKQIGGDCFDVKTDGEGNYYGYVADVCGHGVASSLVSTLLSALFNEAFSLPGNPSLDEVGNRVCARFRNLVTDPEFYATGFLFRLNVETRMWEGLNAGHPPPLVFGADGNRKEDALPDIGGLPIGMTPRRRSVPYGPEAVMHAELPPGSTLFLYTDGLIEGCEAEGNPIGMDGLSREISALIQERGMWADPAGVFASLRSRGCAIAEDDCILMSIHLIEEASVLLETTFRTGAQEAADLSESLQNVLMEKGWTQESASLAGLVAMEHLMNVTDHAGVPEGEPCEIRATMEGQGERCALLVRDPGRKWVPDPVGLPRQESMVRSEVSERGRGWHLIQQLCLRSFYFRREDWNHHVFEISKEVAAMALSATASDPKETSS